MSAELQRLSDYAHSIFLYFIKRNSERDLIEKIIFVDRDGFFPFLLWSNEEIESRISSFFLITNREILNRLKSNELELGEKEYLCNFFNTQQKSAIVDVGWTGNSKKMIESICDIQLNAYFFGVHKKSISSIKSLFNRSRISKYLGETELIEHIFTAPYPQATFVYGSPNSTYVLRHDVLPENREEYILLQRRFAKFRTREVSSLFISKIFLKLLIYKILIFPKWETILEFRNVKHSVIPGEQKRLPIVNFVVDIEQDRILMPFWNLRVIFNFKNSIKVERMKLFSHFLTCYFKLFSSKLRKLVALWSE